MGTQSSWAWRQRRRIVTIVYILCFAALIFGPTQSISGLAGRGLDLLGAIVQPAKGQIPPATLAEKPKVAASPAAVASNASVVVDRATAGGHSAQAATEARIVPEVLKPAMGSIQSGSTAESGAGSGALALSGASSARGGGGSGSSSAGGRSFRGGGGGSGVGGGGGSGSGQSDGRDSEPLTANGISDPDTLAERVNQAGANPQEPFSPAGSDPLEPFAPGGSGPSGSPFPDGTDGFVTPPGGSVPGNAPGLGSPAAPESSVGGPSTGTPSTEVPSSPGGPSVNGPSSPGGPGGANPPDGAGAPTVPGNVPAGLGPVGAFPGDPSWPGSPGSPSFAPGPNSTERSSNPSASSAVDEDVVPALVPEPSSIALLALALSAGAVRRYRAASRRP
jgi:hypothetical protein